MVHDALFLNNHCTNIAAIMQDLVQKIGTAKYNNSGIFLILLFCWRPHYSFSQQDMTLPSQIIADSVTTTISEKDSLVRHSVYKIDSNHKSRQVYLYFRDSYRVIQDMRKLLRTVDYQAVNGYESMRDLIDICRKFPRHKQTELIYMAMAGGTVNLISTKTNRELSKRKIDFLRWQLEKVSYRNNFKFLYMNLHTGLNSRGIVLSVPTLRIYYYRHSSSYYSTDGLIVLPMRKIGINCNRCDGRTLITPFYSTKLGTFELTYDTKYKMISSRIDLRKTSSFVVRIVYVNFLDRKHPDCFLSEALICW
jgi:hypothetical protein